MGEPTTGTSGAAWRLRQVLSRLDEVDAVVAEYAAAYYGRPYRRQETATPRPAVTWSIDKEVVAELVVDADDPGPARLLVHELGLLQPLRKRIRSGHLTIGHASEDDPDADAGEEPTP
jgi:hypothetical protein